VFLMNANTTAICSSLSRPSKAGLSVGVCHRAFPGDIEEHFVGVMPMYGRTGREVAPGACH
jgi:hypothetical protein